MTEFKMMTNITNTEFDSWTCRCIISETTCDDKLKLRGL